MGFGEQTVFSVEEVLPYPCSSLLKSVVLRLELLCRIEHDVVPGHSVARRRKTDLLDLPLAPPWSFESSSVPADQACSEGDPLTAPTSVASSPPLQTRAATQLSRP